MYATDGLLGRDRSVSVVEEYGSIAVAVIENEDHAAVVVHDFVGPVILETDALQRHDSIMDQISLVIDEASEIDTLPDGDMGGGQATIASTVASMTKNLIGCGALSLSNGIALCANTPAAVLAGNFWILLAGALFGYMCFMIGEICEITGRTTYRGIWQETVGHKGSIAVSVANALKAAMADLAYATILSDTLKALFMGAGFDVPRVTCLLLVTISAILPLCLLKNLHVLAPFSVLGTAGIVLTAFAMAVRYSDCSYQPGGKFYDDIDTKPYFGTDNNAWTMQILPFVCMTYEAYVMHYNSARFYTELKDRSLPRFKIAVSLSFSMSAAMYMAIASLGYLTFGGNSSGYILNNYSAYDPLATVSRLAVGVSTLTAYPIVFIGVRDGILDIFEVPLIDQTSEKLNALTLLLLSVLTVTAIFVTDLGLINAVGGGLVTSPIVFIFPTIMYRSAVKHWGGYKMSGDLEERRKVVISFVLTVISVIIGIIGAWTAVANGNT